MTPHDLREHPDAVELQPRGARVVLDSVTFRFPSGRQIFRDLSLAIEPGQRVGLVGPSGSGKSTLIALVQRLYPRSLFSMYPDDRATTPADRRAYASYARTERQKDYQTVDVSFDQPEPPPRGG